MGQKRHRFDTGALRAGAGELSHEAQVLTRDVVTAPFRLKTYRMIRKILIGFILVSIANVLFSYFFYTPKMYRILRDNRETVIRYRILQDRIRSAKTAAGPIGEYADVSVFLPLDALVADAGTDNLRDALARGVDTLASGVTLLWRILEKPGYIQLGPERLRNILVGCGRGQFATATASGEDRTKAILAALADHPLLARDASRPPVRTLLVGVLAGDDLRLSEIADLSCGLSAAFGPSASIELGTVNDEQTFSGRLSVVVLLFEEHATHTTPHASPLRTPGTADGRPHGEHALAANSRFRNAEKTVWHDEDLDVPTFIRRNLTLDR